MVINLHLPEIMLKKCEVILDKDFIQVVAIVNVFPDIECFSKYYLENEQLFQEKKATFQIKSYVFTDGFSTALRAMLLETGINLESIQDIQDFLSMSFIKICSEFLDSSGISIA